MVREVGLKRRKGTTESAKEIQERGGEQLRSHIGLEIRNWWRCSFLSNSFRQEVQVTASWRPRFSQLINSWRRWHFWVKDLLVKCRYSNSSEPESISLEFIGKENWALAKLGRDSFKVARKNMLEKRTPDFTAYDSSVLRRVSKRYFTWMNSTCSVLHMNWDYEVLEKCQTNDKHATKFKIFKLKTVVAISLLWPSPNRPNYM